MDPSTADARTRRSARSSRLASAPASTAKAGVDASAVCAATRRNARIVSAAAANPPHSSHARVAGEESPSAAEREPKALVEPDTSDERKPSDGAPSTRGDSSVSSPGHSRVSASASTRAAHASRCGATSEPHASSSVAPSGVFGCLSSRRSSRAATRPSRRDADLNAGTSSRMTAPSRRSRARLRSDLDASATARTRSRSRGLGAGLGAGGGGVDGAFFSPSLVDGTRASPSHRARVSASSATRRRRTLAGWPRAHPRRTGGPGGRAPGDPDESGSGAGCQSRYVATKPRRNAARASSRGGQPGGPAPSRTVQRNATCASRSSRSSNRISGSAAGSIARGGAGGFAPPPAPRVSDGETPAGPRVPPRFAPRAPGSLDAPVAFSTAAETCARPFFRKFIAAADARRGAPGVARTARASECPPTSREQRRSLLTLDGEPSAPRENEISSD